MPRNDQPDRTNLTFSQAEGLEPLPQPLALGELSREVRNLLWEFIFEELSRYSYARHAGLKPIMLKPWRQILYDLHVRFHHQPPDEFPPEQPVHAAWWKDLIFNSAYNKIFDNLQFVLRHPESPDGYIQAVAGILRAGRAAYTVIPDGPTIIPSATPEEGAAITEAFRLLAEAGFDGARSHLRGAAEALSAGDSAGSVRESIHAVESVARRLNADASTALTPALNALAKQIQMHPALKAGFSKIYGYTNDEDGIRHALLEGDADVDVIDATFMLGACASFVTYLINKARGSGLIEGG